VNNATDLVLLAGAVVVLAPLARRIGVAAPLLLVVAGVLASYVPAFPEYTRDPDVVLVGILPPLLYAAALRTSLIDARRDKRAIALLSVGLVVFSTLVVGVVAWWLVPGLLLDGCGMGLSFAPLTATVLARVPAASAGSAGGMLTTGLQVGNALGVALIGLVFYRVLADTPGPDAVPAAFRACLWFVLAATALFALVVQALPGRRAAGQ